MSQSLAFKKLLNGLKSEASEARGNPVLGWTCTYLPLEILDAAGLSSYRILPETSSERADAYLDPNFCPFISRTYDTRCRACISGCRMPVEMAIDQWNPKKKRYRFETFCYGPKSCSFYRAGLTKKVP